MRRKNRPGGHAVARWSNHYEAAFAAYLRRQRVAYVAVDEQRRSLMADRSLKSLDFVVAPRPPQGGWLVDVKGRRFPSGRQRQYWKNWSTADDLRSLARWEEVFGGGFRGLLVFAYNVWSDRSPVAENDLFVHRDRCYGFVGIRLRDYVAHARVISPRWQTVSMPVGPFRQLARPLRHWLEPAQRAAAAAGATCQPAKIAASQECFAETY